MDKKIDISSYFAKVFRPAVKHSLYIIVPALLWAFVGFLNLVDTSLYAAVTLVFATILFLTGFPISLLFGLDSLEGGAVSLLLWGSAFVFLNFLFLKSILYVLRQWRGSAN